MRRFFSLGSPLGSAVALRLAQLAVMAAAGHSLAGPDRESTLAAFGVVAAFGIFTDTGASTYILTRESVSPQDLRLTMWVQGAASALSVLASVIFCTATLHWSSVTAILTAPLALAVAQAAESVGRVARSSRLQAGDDVGFAANDAILAAAKAAAAIALIFVDEIWVLLFLPVTSIAITLTLARLSRVRLISGRDMVNYTAAREGDRSVCQILKFGLAGASSGFYSQGPFLVVAAVAPPHAVAALSVLLRAVQPLEIAPSIASQQVIPRISPHNLAPGPVWRVFFAVGAATGVAVWLLAPLIGAAFNQPLGPALMLLLVVLSIPPKFGNYALAAFLLQRGRILAKAMASLTIGILVTVACIVTVPLHGSVAAGGAILGAEVLLALALGSLLTSRAEGASE